MKTYEINKTFANYADCKAWEDENIIDRKYNGGFVFMVNHTSSIHSDEVILNSIVTV